MCGGNPQTTKLDFTKRDEWIKKTQEVRKKIKCDICTSKNISCFLTCDDYEKEEEEIEKLRKFGESI